MEVSLGMGTDPGTEQQHSITTIVSKWPLFID